MEWNRQSVHVGFRSRGYGSTDAEYPPRGFNHWTEAAVVNQAVRLQR